MSPPATPLANPRPDGSQLQALADALASVVHTGQYRKGTGEPYVNHVRRVAGRVKGWHAKTVALLHDVIEDTPLRDVDLERIGFPREIVRDVVALSRKEFPARETYADFIDRTIRDGSDDALRVKLADLQDNLTDPWASQKLATRYIPAVQKVAVELERRASA